MKCSYGKDFLFVKFWKCLNSKKVWAWFDLNLSLSGYSDNVKLSGYLILFRSKAIQQIWSILLLKGLQPSKFAKGPNHIFWEWCLHNKFKRQFLINQKFRGLRAALVVIKHRKECGKKLSMPPDGEFCLRVKRISRWFFYWR